MFPHFYDPYRNHTFPPILRRKNPNKNAQFPRDRYFKSNKSRLMASLPIRKLENFPRNCEGEKNPSLAQSGLGARRSTDVDSKLCPERWIFRRQHRLLLPF
jgi:hypothetical protein